MCATTLVQMPRFAATLSQPECVHGSRNVLHFIFRMATFLLEDSSKGGMRGRRVRRRAPSPHHQSGGDHLLRSSPSQALVCRPLLLPTRFSSDTGCTWPVDTIFHLIFQDDEECGQRGEQGPPLLLLDSPSSSTDVKQSGVHVPWIFEAYGAFAWDHTHGQLARTSKQDQAWYASSSASLRGTRNSHREVVSGP